MGKNSPSHFCSYLTLVLQAGVRPGIVVKEKDVFDVSVRNNFTVALSQFVQIFLVPLMKCCEVEVGNFTVLLYWVLLTVGKMC
jgi:hypothetical protein